MKGNLAERGKQIIVLYLLPVITTTSREQFVELKMDADLVLSNFRHISRRSGLARQRHRTSC